MAHDNTETEQLRRDLKVLQSRYAWARIETAPKDKHILVHREGTNFITSARWSERRGAWCYDFEMQPLAPYDEPTHWTLLPPPLV